MLLCCLWHNVETSCHKHFVVVSRYQQTLSLITSDYCHNLRDRGLTAPYIHLAGRSVDSTQWSQISESRFLPTPPAFDAPIRGRGFLSEYWHAVWYGKSRMDWLPEGLKICLFFLTESTNVTHRQTHTQTYGQTPHDDIGCACIASRGKNICSQTRPRTAAVQPNWVTSLVLAVAGTHRQTDRQTDTYTADPQRGTAA